MKRSWVKTVSLFAIALGVMVGYVAGSIYLYQPPPTHETADAAIVLGAAVWGDQPSPVFQERINHAIDLYQARQVEKLIFTGGEDGDGRAAEAVVAKNYANAQGVAEADILIETESQITWTNLLNAQAVAEVNGLTTFIIVSDPLHMKRAMLMAHDLGMQVTPSPTPTTRYRTWRTQLGFLARETFFYLQHLAFRPFLLINN